MILCLLFLTPNSPRWLVFNDRYEEALKVLHSVRRKEDIDNGLPELELASMREEGHIGKRKKGAWKDLVNTKNRRRTGYVTLTVLDEACPIMRKILYGDTNRPSAALLVPS